MPKPICFMIMPFGKKETQAEPSVGVAEIDFNALWDRAYAPVIETLGYEPVRADQDTGSMIITQMIERLYFADLVLADMTIPNGNVYYEVGIRHAAKKIGCVLLAAEWSKALFDVAQMRTLRYPLPEGSIAESTAEKIRTAIKEPIDSLGRGISPIFESIPGYPSAVNPATASSMKDVMAELAALQGEIRAVRALPRTYRMAKAKVTIAYGLSVNDPGLSTYRDRQIVDLSAEPRVVTLSVEHEDTRKAVHFSETALTRIKNRLDELGISPNSFPWRPENIQTASPYPGLGGFEENHAGLFFGRAIAATGRRNSASTDGTSDCAADDPRR